MRISRKRLKPRLLVMYALALALIWSARPTLTSACAGLLVLTAGETLRLWATGYLHKTESLTVAGPYAYVRHPLYLGTLLISSGFAMMANTAWAYALFGILVLGYFGYYMPYKNRIEGARLEELFGDSYRRYAVAVPRLIPRLHAYVPLGGVAGEQAQWQGVRFADNHETGVALSVALGALAVFARWILL